MLASASATVAYGLNGMKNLKYHNQSMLHSSQDSTYLQNYLTTSRFNRFFLKNGVKDLVESYKPAWFYVNPHLGLVYGFLMDSVYRGKYQEEKVRLEAEDGDLSLRVIKRLKDHKSG